MSQFQQKLYKFLKLIARSRFTLIYSTINCTITFQYTRSATSGPWINVTTTEQTQKICGYSPYELVQCRLRAKNRIGYSDVATSNTVRTHCTGKQYIHNVHNTSNELLQCNKIIVLDIVMQLHLILLELIVLVSGIYQRCTEPTILRVEPFSGR